uniref:Uncharacterized protein n=1 Tax=Sphaerodactylus townsendi TaxID=933632 RepID=A0ACB8G011_9SAUR
MGMCAGAAAHCFRCCIHHWVWVMEAVLEVKRNKLQVQNRLLNTEVLEKRKGQDGRRGCPQLVSGPSKFRLACKVNGVEPQIGPLPSLEAVEATMLFPGERHLKVSIMNVELRMDNVQPQSCRQSVSAAF